MLTSAPARPGAAADRATGRRRRGGLLTDPQRVGLAGVALLVFLPCVDVLSDPDVWWHIRAGRWILDHAAVPRTELFSYTASGHPWTAHEWLSEAGLAALAGAGGLALAALAAAAVSWSGLIACGLRARARGASPLAVAVALVLGVRAAEPVLGTRPQVATFALLAWVLLVTERHLRRGGRGLWLLPPMFALWANLHAGFLGGLLVLGVLLAAEALAHALRRTAAPWRRLRDVAAALVLSTAATMLSPAGPGLLPFAVRVSLAERSRPIVEWQPPNFHDPAMAGLLALIVSFGLLAAISRRLSVRDAVLAAAGIASSLMAVRNTALCVVLVLPTWAILLDAALDRLRRPRPALAGGVAAGFGAAVIALSAIAAGTLAVTRARADAAPAAVAARYPAGAAAVLAATPGDLRVFAPYADGGYLVDRLWPHARVFVYGEDTVLGHQVLDDYLRVSAGSAGALQVLGRTGTNAVLAPDGPLARQLRASGRWRQAGRDGDLSVWLRR